ncbi:ABC transporter related protein [Oceanococcus atlanticus]|uniref:ABC transporter related protein n=1 Tax=Oceanococcus atlanticus TaxID=1317117 RepID=A0A1Y1SFA6_9GAMM|nr:ATP-binding cassette domain-containing protein [Oceanococcus atlanticus]ORE88335.1 ABC transporter related protein [Oceanococcus atlanticus]
MSLAIQAEKIEKSVGSGSSRIQILNATSVSIDSGETVAILGRSGAGKTTLLSLLAGLDQPSAGRILLDGHALNGLDEEQRAKVRAGRVGFVFQSFQLLSGFTALENVRLSAELAGLSDARERAISALKDVELGHRLEHLPRQLSGGEKQRVALARAFVARPAILFADEPTGNLDAATGAHIVELMFALNAQHGTTLVLVTHDEALAARCQRQLRLRDGQLVNA